MLTKRLGWIFGSVTLGAFFLWALLVVAFPPLVERGFAHLVAGFLPDQPFSCTVRRLGVTGAEFEDIVLGNPENPAIRIDTLRLNYALTGLLSRHVESLSMDGLRIHGQWLDHRLVLDGFSRSEETVSSSGPSALSLPVTIGRLGIDRGLIRCGLGDRTEHWPFRLQLEEDERRDGDESIGPITGLVVLQPDGHELAVTFRAELVDGALRFQVKTDDLPLDVLAAFLGHDVTGRLHGDVEGQVGLSPFVIHALELRSEIERFEVRGERKCWLLQGAGEANELPLVLSVTVRDGKWRLASNGLALRAPIEVMAPELVGEGVLTEDGGVSAGSLRLARILINGQDLGGFFLEAEKQVDVVVFTGNHASAILEGMIFEIKGEAGFSQAGGFGGVLHVFAPKQKFIARNPERLLPGSSAFTLTGELELKAALSLNEGKRGGRLQFQLMDARLEHPASEFVALGLELSLAFPDLFQFRSPPAQPLQIALVKLGRLAFSDGRFAFQVESPDSLLLETGVFGWSDGRVLFDPLRLSTIRQDYEVTLRCERLSLARLFDQLDVRRAEGEGELDGTISVKVTDGRLRTVDGLLGSAPGEGGRIRLQDAGVLTTGVSSESPQFAQLDFAGEALKDFRYNTARLALKGQGDDLLLQIKLDGQPVHPLPFSYDGRLGGFVRQREGQTGGLIHPVHLDINLRLPFETILEYGGDLRKLHKMTR